MVSNLLLSPIMKEARISLILIISLLLSCSPQKEERKLSSNQRVDYSTSWEKVESLEAKGLQRTAVQELNLMITSSVQYEDYDELFKALAYRAKYIQRIDEHSAKDIINSFHEKIKEVNSPGRELLQSALAEIYLQYLQSNLWTIRERTKRSQYDESEIELLSELEIEKIAESLYLNSIQNSEINSQISLSNWEKIYLSNHPDSVLIEHLTVYDFLSVRALWHFENKMSSQDQFDKIAEEKSLFANSSEFIDKSWGEKSSTNAFIIWLEIISRNLELHLKSKEETAHHFFNIKRLEGVYNYSTHPQKEQLYENALKNELERASTSKVRDRLRSNLSILYQQKDQAQKAVEICKRCEDKSSFGFKRCAALSKEILSSIHNLQTELVYPTDRSLLFSYSYKNIDTAFFRIVQLQNEEVWGLNLSKAQLEDFLSRKAIRSWTKDLRAWNDYKEHRTELSTEALTCGDYLLMVSDRTNFDIDSSTLSVVQLKISDIAFLERGNQKVKSLQIKNRMSGAPLSNAKLLLYEPSYNQASRKYNWKKKKEIRANADGQINIEFDQELQNFRLRIEDGDQYLVPNRQYYMYNSNRQKAERTQTDFFTDRNIYRPGQTLYFKGIMYSSMGEEEKIKRSFPTLVQLYDPRGEKIDEISLRTNQMGSFSGEFQLPKDALNGVFRIANKSSSYSFRVEEYRRPNFQIKFDSINSKYSLGDTLCASGKLLTYTGLEVNQASIQYKIVRRNLYFPRAAYNSFFPNPRKTIIKRGNLTLEDNSFSICFPTENRSPNNGSYSYEVVLSATDPLGETIEEKKSFVVGTLPFRWKLDLKENLTVDELNKIKIKAENVNRKEVSAKGVISIWKLKTPRKLYLSKVWQKSDHQLITKEDYTSSFPYFSHNDKWKLEDLEKDRFISQVAFETSKAINSFRDLEEGAYRIQISSKEGSEDSIVLVKNFRIYKKDSKKLAFPEFFWSELLSSNLKEEDQISVQLNSSLDRLQLLLELEHQGEIIASKKVEISNEKKWLALDTYGKTGAMALHISGVKEGRSITKSHNINISPAKKKFSLFLKTKRDYTKPGSTEKWTIGINDLKDDQEIEVLASMYDRSLDKVLKQEWKTHPKWIAPNRSAWIDGNSFGLQNSRFYRFYFRVPPTPPQIEVPYLNWFGFFMRGNGIARPYFRDAVLLEEVQLAESNFHDKAESKASAMSASPQKQSKEESVPRTDFRETVFFYPQIQNEGEDEIDLEFKMPDALTEWKLRILGHDEDLNFYQIDHPLISKKELMVKAFFPRFMRVNDETNVTIEVRNESDSIINGKLNIEISDAESGQALDLLADDKDEFFYLLPNQVYRKTYGLRSPVSVGLLKYSLNAKSDLHQDIEEGFINVLPSQILLQKSFAFEVEAGASATFNFNEFAREQRSSIKNHRYTVNYTADPRWLAVYALPSMLKESSDNPEMVFSSLYAHVLSELILKKLSAQNDLQLILRNQAIPSSLEKNDQLNYLSVENTPWLSASRQEKVQRAKLASLFNANQSQYKIDQQLKKLKELQLDNGAWPWFRGMRANRYISQYIYAGLERMKKLNVFQKGEQSKLVTELLSKVIPYLEEEITKDFDRLKKKESIEENDHLNPLSIHYLYARSFDKNWKPNSAEVFYLQQSERYWQNKNVLLRSQIALASLQMNSNAELGPLILASIKDIAIRDSLGIHWKFDSRGPYWYSSEIEAQAYIMELYRLASPSDPDLEMAKKWLLHQKQQSHWPGNTATAKACYSLLSEEGELVSEVNVQSVVVANEFTLTKDQLPAHLSRSWEGNSINSKLSKIEVQQDERSLGWGAAHWQYFEDANEVDQYAIEGLKINTSYYLYELNEENQEELKSVVGVDLKVGDLIRQRTEIIINYDLDYVFISDQAPACLESKNALSGIEYRDGLTFYSNIKDSEKQWFIDHLPKGRYVLETDYRISHSGNFKGGVSKLQCMYAPHFTSHSSAGGLSIK